MFKAGLRMVHVPYRGAAPALTDLLGGQVQVVFGAVTATMPYISTGKVRALAVTGTARSELLPDIPTVGELVPGYEASAWYGIGAPKGTPVEIVDRPGVAPDVLVVGAGNAALCAAISAHQNGARVLMLEAAPFEERGGNSHFTGGAFRFAFAGVDDLLAVLPSLAQERLENVDFGTYTQDQFFDDLFALTQYRSDPDLLEILVRGSLDTAKCIAQHGVKLQPRLGRHAYQVDGKFKFWGGLALHIWGGGPELLNALYANV